MQHPDAKASVEKVPLRTWIAWGCGGLADNYIMNVLTALGMVIYVTWFKLDPKLAGIAMFIPRFIDSIFDPLLGNLSDNTRSRFGRRRPYMLVGVLASALLMPLLWMPPMLGTVAAPWHHNGPFLYFTIIGTIYALAYSLFVVPYTALGYELTNDYDERTRTLAWRMYIGLFGSMTIPGLYKVCVLKIFPNEGVGAVWVSVALALVVIVTGLVPVLFCRERADVQVQKSVSIIDAMHYTFTNRPFMILTAAYLVIIIGLFSASNIGMFISIYYICQGSKEFAGNLGLYAGLLSAFTSYGSMFLITAISVRWSKRLAMNLGLGLGLVSTIGSWFAMDPRWPYATLITTFISSLGMQGCWLMVSSMIADVCDEDELTSGVRREGMFGAVNGFTQKLAIAVTSLIGGFLVSISGFNQNTADKGLSLDTAIKMKTLIVSFHGLGILLAMLVFLYYPISRERAAETRRRLDERKRQRQGREKETQAITVTP